jgi:hypothetical protein
MGTNVTLAFVVVCRTGTSVLSTVPISDWLETLGEIIWLEGVVVWLV